MGKRYRNACDTSNVAGGQFGERAKPEPDAGWPVGGGEPQVDAAGARAEKAGTLGMSGFRGWKWRTPTTLKHSHHGEDRRVWGQNEGEEEVPRLRGEKTPGLPVSMGSGARGPQ